MDKTSSHIKKFIHFLIPSGKSWLLINRKNYQSKFNKISKKYDYIVILNVLETETDIQTFLDKIYSHLAVNGRVIIIYHNYLYSFIKGFISSLFGRTKNQDNWLSTNDIYNFLKLTNFDPIVHQPLYFIPINKTIMADFLNRFLLYFFPFNHLAAGHFIIARKAHSFPRDTTVTMVIPARNEAGTIERIFTQLPVLGSQTEVIFVEGHSQDNTRAEIKRCLKKYKHLLPFAFKLINQGKGRGKADAVKKGLKKASGDILIIYDADMSIKPCDLSKFYLALINGKGDFINGSRLVYPMQGKAMQFLNILGNKIFSIIYSWLLGQPLKDTLCGTKAFYRKDYLAMLKDKQLAGAHDPFGDFFLLLGAGKLNLKIIDIPVHYYERTYGATNIKRFQNGWELAKFSLFALKKLKMRL